MNCDGVINSHKKALSELAERQHGYFTASQAIQLGYQDSNHRYHVEKGNWRKISAGLFRLPDYPDSMESDFARWSWWSRNQQDQPQGIISHASALALHGLREYRAGEVHLTVPPRFQKSVPAGVVIHKASLNLSAIECRNGFMVTRLGQTLADLRPEFEARGEWSALLSRALAQGGLAGEELAGFGLRLQESPGAEARQPLPAGPNLGVLPRPETLAPAPDKLHDTLTEGVWELICKRTEIGRRRAQAGFTLVELLVVMTIITVLAALLLPSLTSARDLAREVECKNNLRQFYTALLLYVDEYGNLMPAAHSAAGKNTFETLYPYAGYKYPNHADAASWPLPCPVGKAATAQTGYFSYAGNNGLFGNYEYRPFGTSFGGGSLCNIQNCLSEVMTFIDSGQSYSIINSGTTERISYIHGRKAALVYLDGHAGAIRDPIFLSLPASYRDKNSAQYLPLWAHFWGYP